jgi:hypothetical protein
VGLILNLEFPAYNELALWELAPPPDDLNPPRLELAPNPVAVGCILAELLLPPPNAELPTPALDALGLENLREPDAVGTTLLTLDDDRLFPKRAGFDAGTAVTVGVTSLLVTVVAP